MTETELPGREPLTIAQAATMACLLEASVPKPGNVHRGADFADMTYYDFALSAALIGPAMENAQHTGPGRAALRAMQATRGWVPCNTNLGTILLLAPLAAAAGKAGGVSIAEALPGVLSSLTADDAADVYEAIRVASPGGLGKVPEADVADVNQPPPDLLYAMGLAAERDLVARQYVNGFAEVLGFIVPRLGAALVGGETRGLEVAAAPLSLPDAIVHTAVATMHAYPDSLIARKCGVEVAKTSAKYAGQVLDAGPPGSEDYFTALGDLDFWLRSDGNRRNPGTTADLMAAGLFVAIWEGVIAGPVRW